MRAKLCQNLIMNNEIEFEFATGYEILREIVMLLDEMILDGLSLSWTILFWMRLLFTWRNS